MHVVFIEVVVPKANEVGHIPLELDVLILRFTQSLLQLLVLHDQVLLFIVDNSHLINKVFCSRSFVINILKPGKSLIGFKKLSLILLNDLLVLLSGSMKLLVVSIHFVLMIKVLLEELVPLSLADPLSLL
jgi:hypothetical protein